MIDVFSRFVLAWSLSNTMTAEWCTRLWLESTQKWGFPEIINTDQGSQYTSQSFTQTILEGGQNQLSMDVRGRATDNAFIERLWRTVKYEYIYLYTDDNALKLRSGLERCFAYYNTDRDHSSLERI